MAHMDKIKYIRVQVDGHTIVEFINGSRACSCGLERGFTPSLIEYEPEPLPIHRTEAGYPRCSTCDGGGCLDCTDPA